MPSSVPEKAKISPFLVFFIVHSMQIGVGVLGYQRIIALTAGYDAWIAVLLMGLSIHPIIWMIYKMSDTAGGDLFSIHSYIFGEKLGKWFMFPFIFYFSLLGITTVRAFIEVIQVWMFPDLTTFWFALAFYLLVVYIVFGGFRTVTGIVFFGVVLPSYLIFMFFFTFQYSDLRNLMPVFDHSLKQLALASYKMSLTYLGYEVLLLVYPFIKNPKKSQKWAHLGILYTTTLYLILTVVTFAFFSEGQLQLNVWATLTMWKIVEMPFVERFEYIGIANWNLIILPNVCLAVWGASRLLKQTFQFKQKKGVLVISAASILAVSLLKNRDQINLLLDYTGKIGFIFTYGYIPLLFVVVMIAKKVKKNGST